MPNWTAKLTAAANDATGSNANINITITATNSVTQEVQTRTYPGNNWTQTQVTRLAQDLIASLVARDTALPIATAALNATLANG